jgi:two-component system chemotaxis response regulator CheY/two-component system cell cycle response regulator DivK
MVPATSIPATKQPGARVITVAIAEDSLLLRQQLKLILEQQGFKVVVQASHGAELLAELAGLRALPDLCLCDICMPVMDGFETVKALKKNYPTIKILSNSSYDSPTTIKQVLGCGADGFIAKGSSAREYANALRRILE